MQIGVLGVNHKSSELSTREKMAKACQKKLNADGPNAEKFRCVVIATCHRIEVYFTAENLAEAQSEILHVLKEEIAVAFEHHVYSYFGFDCFLHLAQVTSGLDSVIIAESEIQRQVKVAYEQAQLYYRLPNHLHYLFQKCLKIGKDIRSSTQLSQSNMSIAKMLYTIGFHLLKNIESLPILFIGNSEINRNVISYFKKRGAQQIALCTRSVFSAKEYAEKEGISLISWEDRACWTHFPLVISGSNAAEYVIDFPSHAIQTKLIFDLSVPRNVNPQLKRHPALTLLNMEEISRMLENHQIKNQSEIAEASSFIHARVHNYIERFHNKVKRALECV